VGNDFGCEANVKEMSELGPSHDVLAEESTCRDNPHHRIRNDFAAWMA
jgi:hypothetical protein